MTVLIAAFLASLIPGIIVFVWLSRIDQDLLGYSDSCKKAVLYGMLSTLPVAGIAIVLYLLMVFTGLAKCDIVIVSIYEDYIMAALLEETMKFLFFRKVLSKTECDYSWRNLTAFMTLVGLGFGFPEAIEYGFVTGPGQMLVRGLTLGHAGYGFILGWFYGKTVYTGEKKYAVLGFLLVFLLHGTYDFTLTPEFDKYGFIFDFIPVTLAIVSLITAFVMIGFFLRSGKKEKYTAPLSGGKAQEQLQEE